MSLDDSRFLSDCRSILRRCWKLVVSTWEEVTSSVRESGCHYQKINCKGLREFVRRTSLRSESLTSKSGCLPSSPMWRKSRVMRADVTLGCG